MAKKVHESAHERQQAIAANPAAVLVIASKGVVEGNQLDMTKPGLRAYWTIETDCAEDFLRDAALAAYIKRGAPVIAVFESKADADMVAKRLGGVQ